MLGEVDHDLLGCVRALHRIVLDDEEHGRIGPEYRTLLLMLRRDIDRIVGDLCGRCGEPLGGEVGWHERCPT